MSNMQINDVIQQMRALTTQSQQTPAITEDKSNVSFTGTLKSAIDKVNDIQTESKNLKAAFEAGDPNVSLAQAMVASQKSSIAFQATVQVRNKFIEAYKDIMNMPI